MILDNLNLPLPVALEILETFSEGINIYDINGNITFCNPASLKILGVKKEDLLGLNIFKDFGNIIGIDGIKIEADQFPATESLKTGKNILGRVIGFLNPNGKTIWINVSAYNFKSTDPNFKVFVCFREYTQTLTLLKDLYQKNFELELMTSNYPNGSITLLDSDLQILFTAGKNSLSNTLTAHELVGQNLSNFITKEIFEILKDKTSTILLNETFQTEFLHDGEWNELCFQKTKQKDSHSKYVLVINNINSKKILERELMLEKLSYQNIVENLPGFVFKASYSSEFTPLYVSDSVVNTTGFSSDEYFDNSSNLRNIEYNNKLKEKLWSTISNQTLENDRYQIEYQSKTKEGETIWLWEKGKIVKDEVGNPIYIEGFVMDITTSKLAQLELQKTKNSLQMASKMAKIGSWSWFLDNDSMEWDEEFCNILEISLFCSQEEILNRLQSLLHPVDKIIYNEFYTNQYLPQETKIFHQRLLFPDKIKHVDSIINPIKNQNGEVIGLHGTLQDVSNQKNIITQLDDEKIKFNTIMDALNVVIWEIDFQNRKVNYISPKVEIIYGGKKEEWYNIEFWEANRLFDQSTLEQIQNPSKNTLLSDFKELECELIMKGRKKKWIRNVITFSTNGNLNIHRGVLIDITEQKTIEFEKFDMQRRVELLSNNIPGFLFQLHIAPPKNKILYVSEGIKKLFKKEHKNLMNNFASFVSLIHPDDLNELKKSFFENIKKKADWNYEFRCLISGEYIWIRCVASPEIQKDGSAMVFGYINNIQEEKSLANELHMLSHVAKKTSNAVIISDKSRKIVWVNDGFTRITGYSIAEAIGKVPGDLLQCPQTNPETKKKIASSLAKLQPIRTEILNKHKLGHHYWLDIEIQPFYDKNNNHIGFIAVESEITERKNQEQTLSNLIKDLQEKNEDLLQFSFMVSHNLRGPVASILGLLELVKNIPDIDYKQIFKMMYDSSQTLDNVIKDLNEILNLRKSINELKLIKFDELLNSTFSIIGYEINQIEVICQFNAPSIVSAKSHLQSIFYNLISNSLKYRNKEIDSWLKISTLYKDEFVTIIFEDNGIGVDLDKYKDKLFGLYQRFNLEIDGKGIGLFLVKNSVQLLGGSIEVFSKPLQGFKTIIKLPLKNA
ncbi:MAG: PAS domain S-box protein [Cytophagales bacterium]